MDQSHAPKPVVATNSDAQHRKSSAHRRKRHRHNPYRSFIRKIIPYVVTAVGMFFLLCNVFGIWWIAFPHGQMVSSRMPATFLFFLYPLPVIALWCLLLYILFQKRVSWALGAMAYTTVIIALYGGYLSFRFWGSLASNTLPIVITNLFLFCLLLDSRIRAGYDRTEFNIRRRHRSSRKKQEELQFNMHTFVGRGSTGPVLGNDDPSRQRLNKALADAGLPFIKSLEDFDFSFQPSLDQQRLTSLFDVAFLSRKENVFFMGPQGVGKTHLAVALAVKACEAGQSIAYTTMADLIEELKAEHAARKTNRERRYRALISTSTLLLIDEFDYTPLSREESHIFYRFIDARYEKISTIFISVKRLEEWSELFHDQQIAKAILDRLLHHSVVIDITGESYRAHGKAVQ